MTDPNNGASIRMIAGIPCRRLSPCSWVKLANLITEHRRPQVQANAAASGIDADKANQQLNEFDSRPTTRADVIDFAFLPPGIQTVYLLAFRQVKPDATEADVERVDGTQDEVNEDIFWLLGLRQRKEEPKRNGDGPLSGRVGESESPTATGTTTPTRSD
jgi:hypothetical protein